MYRGGRLRAIARYPLASVVQAVAPAFRALEYEQSKKLVNSSAYPYRPAGWPVAHRSSCIGTVGGDAYANRSITYDMRHAQT
jgi:hypothetical protein